MKTIISAIEQGEIDRVIHQPVRTKIVAYLAAVKLCDYTTLRDSLKLSDGHMTTHMRELITNNYVAAKKQFVSNKPKTTYSLTTKGKNRLKKYLDYLRKIIGR